MKENKFSKMPLLLGSNTQEVALTKSFKLTKSFDLNSNNMNNNNNSNSNDFPIQTNSSLNLESNNEIEEIESNNNNNHTNLFNRNKMTTPIIVKTKSSIFANSNNNSNNHNVNNVNRLKQQQTVKNQNRLSSNFNSSSSSNFAHHNTQTTTTTTTSITTPTSTSFTNNNLIKSSLTLNNHSSYRPISLKSKRSGSITSLLPLRNDSIITQNSNAISNNTNNNTLSSTTNNQIGSSEVSLSNNNNNNGMPRNKLTKNHQHHHHGHHAYHHPHHQQQLQQQQQPQLQKKRKSNSISILDYCNIISMNTNYQMLVNFYDDTEESMARLSLQTSRNANIEKQASLSEQIAALFGSSNCTCQLCKMKSNDTRKAQQYNFEIIPNKHNSDYSIMKYTYSTPLSQLSPLKLFNLINTDCSINFSSDLLKLESYSNSNVTSTIVPLNVPTNSSSTTSTSFFTSTSFNNMQTNSNGFVNANSANGSISLPPINGASSVPSSASSTSTTTTTTTTTNSKTTNTNNTNSTTNGNSSINNNNGHSTQLIDPNSLSLQSFMQSNSNNPPIYDTRYLYLIDCRLNKKKYEKSRINTAIHYTDLLNDTVYLSQPLDNYTLIVLYDDDGTYLTSSSIQMSQSTATLSNTETASPILSKPHSPDSTHKTQEPNVSLLSSDEMISKLKSKINCNPNKTIHLLSGGFEQFHSKFPFMCTGMDVRSAVDRHKYLTIYPNCVIENQIYIGSGIQAKNWKIIRDLKITHIINCSIEHECVFKDELKYLHLKIEDSYTENIFKIFKQSIKYVEEAYELYYDELIKYEKVSSCSTVSDASLKSSSAEQPKPKQPVFLIHCNLGISRSSSVLIAYLIAKYQLCLYAAFKYVKDKRIQIAPNYSFLRQLKQFEETC